MKHTMLKCLSLALALATLLSLCAVPVIAAGGVLAANCDHAGATITRQEPTCEAPGADVWYCQACDTRRSLLITDWEKDYAVNPNLPLGHDYGRGEDGVTPVKYVPATETADGEATYACRRCGHEHTFPVIWEPICPHTDCVTKTPATCTTAGEKVCNNCEAKIEIPATGHKFSHENAEMTTAPECGVTGAVYTFTCENGCGTKITETMPITAGHSWEYVEAQAPTCTLDGWTEGYKCQYCDAEHSTKPSVVDPALDHDYDVEDTRCGEDGKLDPIDECQDGWEITTCTRCDYKVEKELKADIVGNHKTMNPLPTFIKVQDGTCDENAKEEDKYETWHCSICNKDIVPHKVQPAHEYDAENFTYTAPGCDTWGLKITICKKCGYHHSESLAPTGHSKRPANAAVTGNCETGLVYKWNCTVCGDECTEFGTGEHDYEDVGAKDADCSKLPDTNAANGHTGGKKCSICGDMKEGTVIVAAHIPGAPEAHEATCMQAGYTVVKCTACGQVISQTPGGDKDPNAHDLEKFVINGEGVACGEQIRYTWVCKNGCGTIYSEYKGVKECDFSGDAKVLFPADGGKPNCVGGTVVYDGVTYTVPGFAYLTVVECANGCGAHEEPVVVALNPAVQEDLEYMQNVEGHKVNGVATYDAAYTPVVKFEGSCATGQARVVEYKCAHCGDLYYEVTTVNHSMVSSAVDNADCSALAALIAAGLTNEQIIAINDLIEAAEGKTLDVADIAAKIVAAHAGWTNIDAAVVQAIVDANGRTAGETCSACGLTNGKELVRVETTHAKVTATEGDTVRPDLAPIAPVHGKDWQVAGEYCSKCLVTLKDAVKKAANCTDADVVEVAAVAPTCFADGNIAYKYCTQCNVKWDVDGNVITDVVDPKIAHSYGAWTVVAPICGKDGYTYRVCVYGCAVDEETIDTKDYVCAPADHAYRVDDSLSYDKKTCEHGLYDYKVCDWCSHSYKDDLGDPENLKPLDYHLNKDNDKLYTTDDCTSEITDRKCTMCNKNIGGECDFSAYDKNDPSTFEFHEASCGFPKRNSFACTRCGKVEFEFLPETDAAGNVLYDEDGNAIFVVVDEHVWGAAVGTGKPGEEMKVCKECGEVEYIALTGITFNVAVANRNNDKQYGQEIVDGSIVAVTISSVANNVNVSSIMATLTYNPQLFTYLGFEADNAFGKSSAIGNNVNYQNTNVVTNAAGIVSIMSVAENAENGALQNVKFDGIADYMTLYFRVTNEASQVANADYTFTFAPTTVRAVENGNYVPVDAKANAHDLVEVYELGNINNDAFIRIEDVEALRVVFRDSDFAPTAEMIMTAGDIDQDGDIDLVDYGMLVEYVQKSTLNQMTYAQFVQMSVNANAFEL